MEIILSAHDEYIECFRYKPNTVYLHPRNYMEIMATHKYQVLNFYSFENRMIESITGMNVVIDHSVQTPICTREKNNEQN